MARFPRPRSRAAADPGVRPRIPSVRHCLVTGAYLFASEALAGSVAGLAACGGGARTLLVFLANFGSATRTRA